MQNSVETVLQLLQRFLKNPAQIKQIHSQLTTNGLLLFNITTTPASTLSSSIWIPTLLYNSLIRSYSIFGRPREILLLFTRMLVHQAPPNDLTFPPLIKASIAFPHFGPALHAQAVRRGVWYDPFILTSFVNFYSRVGEARDARRVFDEISRPCVVACNAMLDGLFRNGEVGSAVLLFDSMSERDVVSWTSMISGFGGNGYFDEAIEVFRKMVEFKSVVQPNEATYVSVLSSCANFHGAGALLKGKQIHGYILRHEIELTAFVGTALVDFYGKRGCPEESLKIFEQMDVKMVCTWNAMISSLACNGSEKTALDMFDKMVVDNGLLPNSVTFVAVLTACARGKFLELGFKLYDSMLHEFGVLPIMEHYGCMVDLLGKAGLLREATELIESMPFEPDASVLGALLGACRTHGAIDLGNRVARKLLQIQPLHCGRYVVLSNIHAELNQWDSAADLRKAMVGGGVGKIPAYSLMESI